MANGKIVSRDKNTHGLRGHESIYNVDFLSMAESMIRATANDEGVSNFRITHVKRVTELALEMSEGNNKIDKRKLRIACQVHDMYEYVTTQKNGELAGEFLRTFVDEYYPQMSGDKIEWMKAIEAVTLHSEKTVTSSNKYLDYLQDADVLDKLSVEYVTGWYDTFEASNIKEVIDKSMTKVEKCPGKTPTFKEKKAELIEKLVTHFNLE